jgi:hypothetical protein
MEFDVRFHIDPSIAAALERVKPESLLKAMRGWVRVQAQPTVYAIKQATPVDTGDLAESFGAQIRYNAHNGEVFATIGPRTDFITTDAAGMKTLRTTESVRALARHGGRDVIKAARRGVTVITENGPAKYEYLIETGVDHKGRIARKAGGARMVEAGFAATEESFIRVIGEDAFTFISSPSTQPTP